AAAMLHQILGALQKRPEFSVSGKCVQQPPIFIGSLFTKNPQRAGRYVLILRSDETQGRFPVLFPAISGKYASPNEVLRAVSHINAELVGTVDPTEALVNKLLERPPRGFLDGKQTHWGHSVLVYRVDGIAAGYPAAARIIKPPPLPRFSLRPGDCAGAFQGSPQRGL